MDGGSIELRSIRRLVQVLFAVELVFGALLSAAWLQRGDSATGVPALLDACAVLCSGAAWMQARRGRPVAAAGILALGLLGIAIPLAAMAPATPSLVVLPLLGAAVAQQFITGRTLRRVLILSWIVAVLVAIVIELVPAGGPEPAWYYPFMRVSSYAALIGITLVLVSQYGSRLRDALVASQTALATAEQSRIELERREAHYRTLVEQAPIAIVVVGVDGRIAEVNPIGEQLLRRPLDAVLGRPVSDFIDPADLKVHPVRLSELAPGETLQSERRLIDATGATVTVAIIATALEEGGYQLIAQDISERRRAEVERAHLVQAVEQSADPIVITDASATIVYVNAAFERASGYSRAEAMGANPRLLKSGIQGPEFYHAMWSHLAAGRAWSGQLVNRRKDGTLYREEATISPVRDATGAIVSYVAQQRAVTHEREMAADLAIETGVRETLTVALRHVPADATVSGAAQAICDQLTTLPFVGLAAIEVFVGSDGVQILAQSAPPGYPVPVGTLLPPARAAIVRQRGTSGPWAQYVTADGADGWITGDVEGGLQALAYGPIAHGDEVVGVLALGTFDQRFARTVVEKMPGLVSFSAASSALLAERLMAMRREAHRRAEVAAILADRAFAPVFQPIVDLGSGEVVGYEALTRFDSGERPDICFANAWAVGLGEDLELATLEAALEAARHLPAGRWLDLNAAPRLLEDPARLHAIIAGADRPIVIEITEHETVTDYPRLRQAVRSLGGAVRLAVDDAGAGAANFAHIIELRPDFVKLDFSLVRGVHADLGRQALVVAMRHFARTAGCRLVAEGVESEQEAGALEGLGVEYGQGYLFGRPAPAQTFAVQPNIRALGAA
jgi:PAS domain S-box-containing protein